MNLIDPGHWHHEDGLPTIGSAPDVAPGRSLVNVINANDAKTSIWIGKTVTCNALTCGARFELTDGDAVLLSPTRSEGEHRASVNCPTCGLLTAAVIFDMPDTVSAGLALDFLASSNAGFMGF